MENISFKTDFLDSELPVVLVKLNGYVDQANCDRLQKMFDDLFSSEHFNLIFDLAELNYMSSAGWGIFVGEIKRFRDKGGDIKITNMKPDIYEVFQMLEFYHIIEDCGTVEEALDSYRGTKKRSKMLKKENLHKFDDTADSSVSPSNISDFNNGFEDDTKSISIDVNEDEEEVQKEDSKTIEMDGDFSHENGGLEQQVIDDVEATVDLKRLPIQEKIKKMVAMDPLLSIWQMKKMLKHDDFGREKISFLKLYGTLRKLNLETKTKRYRYFRSC